MKNVDLVIDLQFGSTGKGLIAGKLALDNRPDTIMSAFAPNAGHTFIDGRGNKFVNTMLPNSAVSTSVKQVLIGPGATIDIEALNNEYQRAMQYRGEFRLLIHPHAAVVIQSHRDLESGPMTKIGSTKKGVGEAAIQRIRRDPDNMNTAWECLPGTPLDRYLVSMPEYNAAVDEAKSVLIESAQGYSLSMYHGFYPYVTSRDVSTAQILADVGLPFNRAKDLNVVGCMRTYPIRVANRYNEAGEQVGWSGPCYGDQEEMKWSDIGYEPELTTVTKLPRRIFTFSDKQAELAIRQNGVGPIFLNFCNYLSSPQHVLDYVKRIDTIGAPHLAYVGWLGFGPGVNDILVLDALAREEWRDAITEMWTAAKAKGL